MAGIKVVTVASADDWQGVYVDDELIEQAHSVVGALHTCLRPSCVSLVAAWSGSRFGDEWMNDSGSLPDSLRDLPPEARV